MSGFLKLNGISGESRDPQHNGEFDIESFGYGLGGIFGKTPVKQLQKIITVIRNLESDSSRLLLALTVGTIFPDGKIQVKGQTQTLNMTSIAIDSYTLNKRDGAFFENISLVVENYSIN